MISKAKQTAPYFKTSAKTISFLLSQIQLAFPGFSDFEFNRDLRTTFTPDPSVVLVSSGPTFLRRVQSFYTG